VNKPVKLPLIRKEAFTKARESLGLSTKELSGIACLSIRQIEQIENGESSSFYGAQVKFTAAKKVAGLLKLTPEEAFDFAGIAQTAKVSKVDEKLQGEVNANPEKAQEEKTAEHHSQKSNANKNTDSVVDYRVKSKATADPKKKFFMLVVIGAAVIFSVVNLRPLFFPEPVKEEVEKLE
jgi:transcriptional regulator with XRE-family HTH domain